MRLYRLIVLAFGCASLLAAAPSILGVYNAASWAPPALPNSGIAQGSIFTLTGTGLGPSTLLQAQSYPLPTTKGLGGTTIQVTVNGVTETCIMIYTSANQVAAILPSPTPTGTATLTLSYKSASGSISIPVLAANFAAFTLNEAGSGPAVVTDASYQPITYVHPAHPGQALVLWGTGLGAVGGDETIPPDETDMHSGVEVYLGNQLASVRYGGRSSSPGLDQINFIVPAGVEGCKVSITVLLKGVTGSINSTSIAPLGQATCSESYAPFIGDILDKAVSKGSVAFGSVQMDRIRSENATLTAGFGEYPLNSLIRSNGGTFGPSIGSCIAYEVAGAQFAISDPVQPRYMEAGANLVVDGPGGATQTVPEDPMGCYEATLGTQPSNFITPGTYSASNGAGGSSVGAFNWTLTLPALVTPTNIPASISRAHDLTLTWNGGSAYPIVSIFLYSGVAHGLSISYAAVVCDADALAGTFTIPAAVLNLLPPGGYGAVGKRGVDIQIGGVALVAASNSAGLDVGVLNAIATTGAIATIQ